MQKLFDFADEMSRTTAEDILKKNIVIFGTEYCQKRILIILARIFLVLEDFANKLDKSVHPKLQNSAPECQKRISIMSTEIFGVLNTVYSRFKNNQYACFLAKSEA